MPEVDVEISGREAADLLDDVQRVLARTRRAIVAAHVADHFIVWGLAWIAGFGATYATTWHPGWIWAIVAPVAVAGSVVVGVRSGAAVQSPEPHRLFAFLGVLSLFAVIWAVMLHPFNARHLGAYIATVFMFAYVAGGLWFGRFFVVLGLSVTAIALTGVLVFPAHLDLLMALAGGGSLLGAGVYIRQSWK